jgi:simple sugar transport system permease protein
MVVSTMTISGTVAGIGGAIYILMILGRWRTGIPAVGFDGIAVSILGANNPIGIIPASMLFGILRSGGLAVDAQVGIPRQLVQIIRGLIILFLAMPALFAEVSNRWRETLERIVEGEHE